MGSSPDTTSRPQGLLDATLAMGWRVLADAPGREVVVGAVTRPWQANVIFRGISPEAFAAFREPEYVKIVWTLRVDPLDDETRCRFCTGTRAVATDADGRAEVPPVLGARLARDLPDPPTRPALVESHGGANRRYRRTFTTIFRTRSTARAMSPGMCTSCGNKITKPPAPTSTKALLFPLATSRSRTSS